MLSGRRRRVPGVSRRAGGGGEGPGAVREGREGGARPGRGAAGARVRGAGPGGPLSREPVAWRPPLPWLARRARPWPATWSRRGSGPPAGRGSFPRAPLLAHPRRSVCSEAGSGTEDEL